MSILEPAEPVAWELVRPDGRSPFVLLCDHASARVPAALGTLGLPADSVRSHIGWDIGAAALARRLSALWDAPVVLSGYSRLVIDCNRPLSAPTSIAAESCGIKVPGNESLAPADRDARAREFFWPYHRGVERLLADRAARELQSTIVSIHTFTPRLYGRERPWHVGVLHGRDRRLADAFLMTLGREPGIVVGDNEPYQVTDATDYGLPVHAQRAGRPGVLLEVRQDEVGTDGGVERFAVLLARAGEAALREG